MEKNIHPSLSVTFIYMKIILSSYLEKLIIIEFIRGYQRLRLGYESSRAHTHRHIVYYHTNK